MKLKTIIRQVLWKGRNLRVRASNFGLKFKCPFCSAHLRRFLAAGVRSSVFESCGIIGAGFRENVLCPVCGSTDRSRLIYLWITRETRILTEQTKLLHVAPEFPIQCILRACQTVEYHPVDLEPSGYVSRMDITEIEHPDNSFDFIICSHVLEHIPDDGRAMRELHRVLRPGGIALLQVPLAAKLQMTYEDPAKITPAEREVAFGQRDHVRIYGQDYALRLRNSGFKVTMFSWRESWQDQAFAINQFGLNKDEPLFVCSK